VHVPELSVKAVEPGGGERVAIPGFGAVFKMWSRDTGGAVSVVEHPFAVGTITTPHRHSREDEYSLVLEGTIGFRSDDSEVVLEPGGYILKPRGQMHAMWNAGGVPGRIVEVITPGGFERYFHELAELMAEEEPAPSAFAELATRYGLTYGRPDWLNGIVERYGLTPPGH